MKMTRIQADALWDKWISENDAAQALIRLLSEREIDVLRQGFIAGALETSATWTVLK